MTHSLRIKDTSWKKDLKELVEDYKPDIFILSSTEDMWELGMRILDELKDFKKENNTPVLAGGVFPTFAPEICIKYDLVDMICVGEGEVALVDVCERVKKNQNFFGVTNLWVKKKDGRRLC